MTVQYLITEEPLSEQAIADSHVHINEMIADGPCIAQKLVGTGLILASVIADGVLSRIFIPEDFCVGVDVSNPLHRQMWDNIVRVC